jgi:hypothetical protein
MQKNPPAGPCRREEAICLSLLIILWAEENYR